MPFADIPIWLINAALCCMVATPFVVALGLLYLGHKLEKPGWALYWLTREQAVSAPSLPMPAAESSTLSGPGPLPAAAADAARPDGAEKRSVPVRRHILHSQFGR